jgi:uncharacterized flavoprotein (TIGR03862 family)
VTSRSSARGEAAVVGGGPAGLMAAETLAEGGARVTVFDRMPSVGRKFLLAGRGGLNLTHSEPLERFVQRYGAGPMEAMVGRFPPEALRRWAESLGQPTFVGSSGRVFPTAFKATPLLRAWLRRLGAMGVGFRTGHRWTGWDGTALRFETASGGVSVGAGAAVLALGGASWPRLGSDGAWVPALEATGAVVARLRPANGGFRCDWSPVFRERFAGVPLKRIAATFAGVTVRGEAVVTADGIEGGVIYALSRPLREAILADGSATMMLDLRPDLDAAAVATRLGGRGVSMANAVRRAGLAPVAAGLLRESPAGPLEVRIKALPLRLTGMRGMDRAISTAGGVRFDALERLMLPARPGVFLAGEMLDWEAPTGGYLLQGCFASGRAAGLEALAWMGRDALA